MRQKKILKLLISIVILLGVIVLVAIRRYNNMTKFNDDYVNGNSGGNLYNGGYFCEYEGVVYFRNPNDNNCLYSMDRNRNNVTKLSEDTVAYINADKHYIYYTRNNVSAEGAFSFLNIETYSLCRVQKSNNNLTVLDSDICTYASLVGNYVYYSHYDTETASTVYKVKIDGTEAACVIKQPIIAISAEKEKLYYAGTQTDAHVYCLNTSTGAISKVLETNSYMPIVSDGYLYYINCDKGYILEKMRLSDGEITTLVNKRIDCYNVYGSTIYYQLNDNENSGLYRMKPDGYDYTTELIALGNHMNINVTSTYVYFMKYGMENTIFCTPTVGYIFVTQFSPPTDIK